MSADDELRVTVELSGGAELLFDGVRKHQVRGGGKARQVAAPKHVD